MLLQLPPEIIQNILWHMDPGTLLVSLFVCKRLYRIANSKHVMQHQLLSLPGLNVGLEDLSTAGALRQYRLRALSSLCGSDVLSQVTSYSPGRHKIDVRQCVFCPGGVAIAYQHRSVIKLYDFRGERIHPMAELRPHLLQDDEQGCHIELLKLAFSQDRDVVGLYRYTPHEGNGGPFVAEAVEKARHTLKLVVFYHLTATKEWSTKATFYSSFVQETSDIVINGEFRPVGLALANNGTTCIAWTRTGPTFHTKVSLYTRNKDLMEACGYGQCACVPLYDQYDWYPHDPSPKETTLEHSHTGPFSTTSPPLICNMQFTQDESQLNLYTPGLPIPSWYTVCINPMKTCFASMSHNIEWMCLDSCSRESVLISMPFHYDHVSNIPLFTPIPSFVCRTRFLALAMTYERDDKQAFIVQTVQETMVNACDHQPKLDSGRRSRHWTSRARLDGFKHGHSSLGSIMAIAPNGTRIAISDWSDLRVWALDPSALQEDQSYLHFPARDLCPKSEIAILRHVKLPSQGVIHSMCWQDEDKLYAVTDQGLVRWDVGHKAYGKGQAMSFELET
ncbi:MAG: hypothetical protein M1830_000955 [Pleopsidium flavum]|nr:MAG: hypothetical protein M1830_000955 [Pleopsidium flavum]